LGGVNGKVFAQYTEGLSQTEVAAHEARRSLTDRLRRALAVCSTEPEIVQTLYVEPQSHFGYSVISLQALDGEARLHNVTRDHGVLRVPQ
jgi:hypothetical protein